MLEKLFESIDEKVLTPELKQSLEESFNEAVENRAQEIANENKAEYMQTLDEKCAEFQAKMLSEKDAAVEEFKTQLEEHANAYIDTVVDEFMNEAKESLDAEVDSARNESMSEAFHNFALACGVSVADIVNESKKSGNAAKLADANEQIDSLVKENHDLKEKLESQMNESAENAQSDMVKSVIKSLSEGMTVLQQENFDSQIKNVEFENLAEGFQKAFEIKQNIINEAKAQSEAVAKNSQSLNESHAESYDERLRRLI